MHKGYMLIDGSNIAHAANATKKLTVGDRQVQAIFGVIRTLRPILMAMPTLKPLVLWDGRSWRKDIFEDYKANRDKEPSNASERHLNAQRSVLKDQMPDIRRGVKLLGVRQMLAMNMEADDLAAICADHYESKGYAVHLMSADKDWLQLVTPKITWIDPIHNKRVPFRHFEERVGVKTPRQFLEVKALMGDVGDNIPGVGGIGEKGAMDLINTYGTVNDFLTQVLDKTIDYDTLPKKYKNLADDEGKYFTFLRNMDLMDLRTPKRPEMVKPIVTKSKLDADGFRSFCRELQFRSLMNDDFLEPFERIAA